MRKVNSEILSLQELITSVVTKRMVTFTFTMGDNVSCAAGRPRRANFQDSDLPRPAMAHRFILQSESTVDTKIYVYHYAQLEGEQTKNKLNVEPKKRRAQQRQITRLHKNCVRRRCYWYALRGQAY